MKTKYAFFMLLLMAFSLLACVSTGGGSYQPSPMEQEIYTAVMQGNLNRTKQLLDSGASPNSRGVSTDTILHLAAANNYSDIIKLLVDNNADVNLTNRDDLGPLALAKKPAAVKLLLEAGANSLYVSRIKNMTPFELWSFLAFPASEADKKAVIDEAKAYGYSVNAADMEARLWLNKNDLVETVKLYQKAGYDINKAYNSNKQTPLVIAAAEDNYALINILVDAGAKANTKDAYNDDALNIITRNRQSKHTIEEYNATLKALLKGGADINGTDHASNTPLCNAASIGHLSRVKTLLATTGINLNAPGRDGLSALAQSESLDIAKALVAAKINIESKDRFGSTPLFNILNAEVVSYLLKQGSNANHINDYKQNILVHNMLAAWAEFKIKTNPEELDEKYYKKFEALIAAKIDVNYKAPDGGTALELAARSHLVKIPAILKKAGAK